MGFGRPHVKKICGGIKSETQQNICKASVTIITKYFYVFFGITLSEGVHSSPPPSSNLPTDWPLIIIIIRPTGSLSAHHKHHHHHHRTFQPSISVWPNRLVTFWQPFDIIKFIPETQQIYILCSSQCCGLSNADGSDQTARSVRSQSTHCVACDAQCVNCVWVWICWCLQLASGSHTISSTLVTAIRNTAFCTLFISFSSVSVSYVQTDDDC